VWENNHKRDYSECKIVDLIDLAQNRVRWRNFVNTLINIQFQYKVRNLLTTRETTGFSRTDLHIINYLHIFSRNAVLAVSF
jgi:hypothetical protein